MEKPAHNQRKVSIYRRVALPFITVVIVDCALLVLLLFFGGTFAHMHQSGLSILSEATQNKYQLLERNMLSWSSIDQLGEELTARLDDELQQENKTVADIQADPTLNSKLTDGCKKIMVDHLRNTNQNGIFLILNGQGVPNEEDTYAGLYLYDAAADRFTADNSDLSVMRGLPPVARSLGVSLHSYWQAAFTFPGGKDNPSNDYFYKPLEAYLSRTRTSADAKYYSYWSPVFHLNEMDGEEIITYSRPLVNSRGELYGIYGISQTVTHVLSVLNADRNESSNNDSYYLGVTESNGADYTCVAATGRGFLQNFTNKQSLEPLRSVLQNDQEFLVVKGGRSGEEFYGSIYPLKLYSSNTPFLSMQWTLVGLQNSKSVFSLENEFRNSVIFVVALGLLIGLSIAIFSATSISGPIAKLVKGMRSSESKQVNPEMSTGIIEVDELAQTIAKLNQEAVEEASRISKIITLSGMPIGVFEKRDGMRDVFCSDGFFKVLNCREQHDESNRLSIDTFNRVMAESLGNIPVDGDDTFHFRQDGQSKYIRMRTLRDRNGTIGTLLDVTEEMEQRRRLEHERDYDSLTNLFNRRAFEGQTKELFEHHFADLLPVSALVMMDLDNLKAVNDGYGHDCGDVYIHAFASSLDEVQGERCLVGRRSGDEFYVFYYGYQSRDEIRELLMKGWQKIQNKTVDLNPEVQYKLRASAGIAWFPEDATDFAQLLSYADFAMYRVKNSTKGSIQEFHKQEYVQEGYMVNGIQALNRMLEQSLVHYAFQPIVSAEDGQIMAYELLMRPTVEELPNPTLVLNLAREQGMLRQVEWITWRIAMATAQDMIDCGRMPANVKLFVNSIANQQLTPEQLQQLTRKYGPLFRNVVMEIIESDTLEGDVMAQKEQDVRELGGLIAIDDFGSGYNSDLSLLSIKADFVKLDMSFVRDVHLDQNKRTLIGNTVEYAHLHNIRVIAEGVESAEEMRTLCNLKVDYFQGYYLAEPGLTPPKIEERVVAEIRQMALQRRQEG